MIHLCWESRWGARWAWLAAVMVLGVGTPVRADVVLQYDPALTSLEKQAIDQDIAQLRVAGLHGEKVPYFEKIFGGPGGQDVENYLGERLKVVVAESTDVEAHLEPLASLAVTSPSPSPEPSSTEGPRTIASNVGSAIFFFVIEQSLPGAILRLGDESVEIRSTRSGVIQLGQAYVDGLSSAYRINALVHEARHSDCTGGLTEADKEAIRSSARASPASGGTATSNLCAHPHVKCPPGHLFEGLYACDDHPWGAYSVDAIFAAAMAQACDECTLEAKATGEAIYVDSATRYPEFTKMINGELGDPDMTHTEVPLP